jgi:hypothetical protein
MPIEISAGPRFESKEELDRREQLKGYKFQTLRPMQADHVVVGRDRDNKPVTVGEVEKVFNDAYLIDFVKGPGTFLKHTGPRQEDVLRIAVALFARQVETEGRLELVK